MATVTLYTLPGCVDCQTDGQAMDRKDISFGLIDVAAPPAAAAFIRGLDYQGVPVTVIRNVDGAVHDRWRGFRPDKLRDLALQRAQLS